MFRTTKYDLNHEEKEERELDFSIEYGISETIACELLYAKIFTDQHINNQDKVVFLLTFEL